MSLGESLLEKMKMLLILPILWVKKYFPFTYRIANHLIYFSDIFELHVLVGIFKAREYDIEFRPRIVDLGANIGIASLWFYDQYPYAQIEAYEPDPETFKILQKNVAHLGVKTIQKAISGSNESIKFFHSFRSIGSSLIELGETTKIIEVEGITLDSIIGNGIDILKIDIEGAEFEVLEKCTTLSKIRAIVGEIHPKIANRSIEDFISILQKTHVVDIKNIDTDKTSFKAYLKV